MYTDDGIVVRILDTDEAPTSDALFFEPEEIDDIVVSQVGTSALFASRFRECAARALLLPRRDPGGETRDRQRFAAGQAGRFDRCAERRFLTLEHRTPFAFGGPPSLDNLCLLCSAHNLENARQVFGEPHIETKIRANMRAAGAGGAQAQPTAPQPLETPAKVLSSLTGLGFARNEASAAIGQALASQPGLDVEQLLRRCLLLLIPKAG